MSSGRRRSRKNEQKKDSADLFRPTDSAFTTLEDTANAGYGTLSFQADSNIIVEDIDIFEIKPDPVQPRRALPSAIRQAWDGSIDSIPALLRHWQAQAEIERGMNLDVDAYLHGQPTDRAPENLDQIAEQIGPEARIGPLETAFLNVVDLAASIQRDGLTNPITVSSQGGSYLIETGERRWLAFHLLHEYLDDDSWRRIPARVVTQADVWRQASENNARNDLNAIAKARQFALLMMHLYTDHDFQPIESFEQEQGFYAQVAEGSTFPIPRGAGEKILNAMGFKDKSQYRRHRNLLRLPSPVWGWADDLNWTEGRIRALDAKAKNEEQLILLAAAEARSDGLSVPIGTHEATLPAEPDALEKPVYTRGKRLMADSQRKRFKLLESIGEGVKEADDETRQWLLDEVSELRRWLDSLADELQD